MIALSILSKYYPNIFYRSIKYYYTSQLIYILKDDVFLESRVVPDIWFHILLLPILYSIKILLCFANIKRYTYLQVRFRYGHWCPWMVKRLCLVLMNLGSGWSGNPHLLLFINFFVASSISPVTAMPPNFWKLEIYKISYQNNQDLEAYIYKIIWK